MEIRRPQIVLGIAGFFTVLSLILLLRGESNDSYMAILVFTIALLQLFEYGVWINQDCFPGGANDKASRGAYMLFWLMPAILAFSGVFFGSHIAAKEYSVGMLLMSGIFFCLLTICLFSIMITDKTTWCTTPGNNGQPIWWFLRNTSPLDLNFLWVVGMIIPVFFVEPLIVGSGILIISGISAVVARQADLALEGEWVSSTALMANSIGFWALVAPYIRQYLFFPVEVQSF